MWPRTACAGALAALALAALPAGAAAQDLPSILDRLTQGTSTTATTPAPTETPAPAETTTETTPAPAPAPAPADPGAAPADPAAAATPAPPAAEQPGAGVTEQPIAQAAEEDRGSTALPAVLVALMALGVVLAIGVLAWLVARWLAFDPRWMQRWRHAGREAAYRASGAWADFADWVRLGR